MRSFRLLCATLLLSLVTAAPSLAQLRDPFDPLVTEDTAASGGNGTTGATGDPSDPEATAPPAPETAEGLPTTGGDPTPWLTSAYVLLACGAAAVVLARLGARGRTS